MKIYIKSKDGIGLKLYLPTSWIKCKFIIKFINNNSDVDIKPLADSLPIIYKSLKKHIKENGHFVLINIESSTGDKIFIKV